MQNKEKYELRPRKPVNYNEKNTNWKGRSRKSGKKKYSRSKSAPKRNKRETNKKEENNNDETNRLNTLRILFKDKIKTKFLNNFKDLKIIINNIKGFANVKKIFFDSIKELREIYVEDENFVENNIITGLLILIKQIYPQMMFYLFTIANIQEEDYTKTKKEQFDELYNKFINSLISKVKFFNKKEKGEEIILSYFEESNKIFNINYKKNLSEGIINNLKHIFILIIMLLIFDTFNKKNNYNLFNNINQKKFLKHFMYILVITNVTNFILTYGINSYKLTTQGLDGNIFTGIVRGGKKIIFPTIDSSIYKDEISKFTGVINILYIIYIIVAINLNEEVKLENEVYSKIITYVILEIKQMKQFTLKYKSSIFEFETDNKIDVFFRMTTVLILVNLIIYLMGSSFWLSVDSYKYYNYKDPIKELKKSYKEIEDKMDKQEKNIQSNKVTSKQYKKILKETFKTTDDELTVIKKKIILKDIKVKKNDNDKINVFHGEEILFYNVDLKYIFKLLYKEIENIL